MRGRLRAALRAGYLALFVTLLCTAALAAPALSTQDFGHRHEGGTPGHLHPVASVIGGAPAPEAVAGPGPEGRDAPALRPASSSYAHTDAPQPRSRAPPGPT